MKKYSADLIFPIASDPIQNGVVIVSDKGQILDIGDSSRIPSEGSQKIEGALIPGFVNTHCHLELSHMKGLMKTGTGLISFIDSVVKFRDFPQEEIMDAIAKGDQEMWDNGIVAVGDISNKIDTAQVKSQSNIDYYTFVEMFDFMQAGNLQPTIDQYKPVYEGQSVSGNNKKSYVPHAPYSVGKELFQFIREHNLPNSTISIHNQETPSENELFQKGSGSFYDFYKGFGMELPMKAIGKSAIHYALENMDPSQRTLFVHNTLTTKDDVLAAQAWSKDVFFATCANANLYIENKLPNYQMFVDTNAAMTIGTDSLSSNWQLSVWEEIKTIHRFNSFLPLATLLQWATLNGAKALGYENNIGSLEIGKSPGVLALLGLTSLEPESLENISVKRLF